MGRFGCRLYCMFSSRVGCDVGVYLIGSSRKNLCTLSALQVIIHSIIVSASARFSASVSVSVIRTIVYFVVFFVTIIG